MIKRTFRITIPFPRILLLSTYVDLQHRYSQKWKKKYFHVNVKEGNYLDASFYSFSY